MNEYGNVKFPFGKVIGYTLLFLVVVMALGWVVQGNDFFMYKFWAPKQEQVRRQVFEQTRSFNQSMVQELENMEAEYVREKDPQAKAALASIILHRASGYNLEDPIVPPDLRSFIAKLKQERMDAR